MVEAVDGVLKLRIQDDAVSDNDDRVEDWIFILVENGCQTIGDPCNGVGFAGTR